MCYHIGVEQTKYESRAFSTQSKAHTHHPTGLWEQWNISPVPISYRKCTTDGKRRTDVSLILTEKSQIMHQWQQAHLFRSDLCSFLTCNPNSINSIVFPFTCLVLAPLHAQHVCVGGARTERELSKEKLPCFFILQSSAPNKFNIIALKNY